MMALKNFIEVTNIRRALLGLRCLLIVVTASIMVSGCTSGRLTITASSDSDVGEYVHTRNRYRISVIANDEESEEFATREGRLRYQMLKQAESASITAVYMQYQPNVFAQDGITVVVKDCARKVNFTESVSPVGVGVFLFSAGILPGWKTRNARKTFPIETIDGQRVDQYVVLDMSYLTINTLFPFFRWIWTKSQATTEVIDGHRAFVNYYSDGNQFMWSGMVRNSCFKKSTCRALAYALAARLKKLEEENGVPGGDK